MQHIFTIHPAANMLASALLLSVHGLCYHISPTPLLSLLIKVTEGVQLGFHPSKECDFTLLNSILVLKAYQWCTNCSQKVTSFWFPSP
jgi:hypothetical protein